MLVHSRPVILSYRFIILNANPHTHFVPKVSRPNEPHDTALLQPALLAGFNFASLPDLNVGKVDRRRARGGLVIRKPTDLVALLVCEEGI